MKTETCIFVDNFHEMINDTPIQIDMLKKDAFCMVCRLFSRSNTLMMLIN